jgi:predicted negative regulator of RcsB-dependent stress response
MKLSTAQLRDRLIRQIESAFDGVQLGDGVSLHEAEAIDDNLSEQECAAARKLDRESRWQDVPDAAIRDHSSSLYFMDEFGTWFYLPAYMIWSLKNYTISDSLSISHAASKLKSCRAGQFTQQQCQAIQAYLQFLAAEYQDPDAQEALQDYWADIDNEPLADEQPDAEERLGIVDQINLASRLISFRRFSRATPILRQVLEQSADPQVRSQILTMLSECCQDSDDSKSLACLQEAIEADSENIQARLAFGHWLLIGDRKREALLHFAHALEVTPEMVAPSILGKLLDRPLPLIRDLQRQISAGDYTIEAHLSLAVAFAQLNDLVAAKRQLEQGLNRAGKQPARAGTLLMQIRAASNSTS